MTPLFLLLKMLNLFRVDPEEEEAGLDVSHHGGSAYSRSALTSSFVARRTSADNLVKSVVDEPKDEVNV